MISRETPHGWLSIYINWKLTGKIAFTTNMWTAQGIKEDYDIFTTSNIRGTRADNAKNNKMIDNA